MSKLADKIHNERTKLTAAVVSGLVVAICAVGGLAPTLGLISGQTPGGSSTAALIFAFFCYISSVALHLAARRALEAMRNDDD